MPALTTANLLVYALQMAAIVGIGAGLPIILGLRAPRARLVYYRVLLVVCLALPLLQPAAPPASANEEAGAALAPSRSLAIDVTVEAPGEAAATVPRAWPVGLVLTVLLVGGMALRFTWLGFGVLQLQRLRQTAPLVLPRPPAVQEAAELVGADAEFRSARELAHPVTFGAVLPVVLLPARFMSLDTQEQKAIACHELLHVRRHDWLRTTVDECLRAVAWFHPAVLWLIDQIQLCREQVVDRDAVRLLGARQSYLEALVRMAAPSPRPVLRPASLFLRRAHLRQRVALLVKEVGMSRPRFVASFLMMAVILLGAGRLVVSAFPMEMVAPASEGAPAAARAVPVATTQQATRPGEVPAPPPQKKPTVVRGDMAAHLQETIVVSVPAGATPQRGVAGGVQGGVIGGVPGGVVGGVAGGVVGGVAGGISGGVMGGVRGGVAGGAAFTQRVPGVITRVNPAGVPGIGIVRATIEANGIVSDVQVLRGEGGPGQAAADAVRHWVFESPEQAPVVTILGFNVTSDGGAVDSPPARIGGTIAPPRKIRDVKPVYPTEAGGVGGVQVVESVIDSTGIVRNARSLRIAGSEALMVAAIDAVLRWEFTPLTVNGAATPVLMTVTVNFTVDGSRATVPAGWPTDPVRVGGHIKTPAKVRDVRPVYPPVAEQARVQGVVIVEAVIGPDGRVASTRILRSIPLLDEAALDAVRQWEFTPTFIDGVAVNVIMTLTVNFTLQ